MVKLMESLGDRLLARLVPRVTAEAGPYCPPVSQCRQCGYDGSFVKFRWYQLYSNCNEYFGPCVVQGPNCPVK
ncbi:hypothetical protein ABT294_17680 [Nonomuraea sp. NPDC000554]|uniref:hypothetical protein n=1 Tax=Nonomuraea sp. NPDC000554 TaxID=3154259 RepID=UPI00332ACEDD